MLSKAIEKRLVIGYELGLQSAEDAITAVPNLSRCRAGAAGDAVHRAPSRRNMALKFVGAPIVQNHAIDADRRWNVRNLRERLEKKQVMPLNDKVVAVVAASEKQRISTSRLTSRVNLLRRWKGLRPSGYPNVKQNSGVSRYDRSMAVGVEKDQQAIVVPDRTFLALLKMKWVTALSGHAS